MVIEFGILCAVVDEVLGGGEVRMVNEAEESGSRIDGDVPTFDGRHGRGRAVNGGVGFVQHGIKLCRESLYK